MESLNILSMNDILMITLKYILRWDLIKFIMEGKLHIWPMNTI